MRVLLFLFISLSLVACAGHDHVTPDTPIRDLTEPNAPAIGKGVPQADSISAAEASAQSAQRNVVTEPLPEDIDWTPENLDLSCSVQEGCPEQVGVLLWPVSQDRDKKTGRIVSVNINRCTASLVGADLVLSNGHCDNTPHAGFFVIGYGSAKQVFHVKNVVYKKNVPSDKNGVADDLYVDAALFRLKEKVTSPRALRIASGPQMSFSQLTAFVANQGPQLNKKDYVTHLRIDQINCNVRREEAYFPYEMSETPNVIVMFDCEMRQGNSGSPMFADGSADIQALLQSFTAPDKQAALIRKILHREPQPGETPWMANATNLRCLDLPGSKPQACTTVSDAENKRRYDAFQIEQQQKASAADQTSN